MRYIGTYLLYAAVVTRGLASFAGRQPDARVVAALLVYGLLLGVDHYIYRRRTRVASPGSLRVRAYPYFYLVAQAALVVFLLLAPPRTDFYALLFIPLSMQAVLWFDRRGGFAWIVAFVIAMLAPLTPDASNPGAALGQGVALAMLYGGACYLVGSYARMVNRAEAARRENLRLLDELHGANRQLHEYAARAEGLAVVQERNRLARELHDSVTQTVFSMTLSVQAARMLFGKDNARVAAQLDRLQELAKGAVGEIQLLVEQLRPRSLVEDGLVAALQRHLAEREAREGLRVSLEVTGARALPEATALGLYRIVQEALNNVVKHAGTREATVRLCLDGPPAHVEVQDHGPGFDAQATAAASRRGHVGLAGMAERAREIGWLLSVDSRPGRGTLVRLEEMP